MFVTDVANSSSILVGPVLSFVGSIACSTASLSSLTTSITSFVGTIARLTTSIPSLVGTFATLATSTPSFGGTITKNTNPPRCHVGSIVSLVGTTGCLPVDLLISSVDLLRLANDLRRLTNEVLSHAMKVVCLGIDPTKMPHEATIHVIESTRLGQGFVSFADVAVKITHDTTSLAMDPTTLTIGIVSFENTVPIEVASEIGHRRPPRRVSDFRVRTGCYGLRSGAPRVPPPDDVPQIEVLTLELHVTYHVLRRIRGLGLPLEGSCGPRDENCYPSREMPYLYTQRRRPPTIAQDWSGCHAPVEKISTDQPMAIRTRARASSGRRPQHSRKCSVRTGCTRCATATESSRSPPVPAGRNT